VPGIEEEDDQFSWTALESQNRSSGTGETIKCHVIFATPGRPIWDMSC